MNKNIVVVGGGTAGWITALMIKNAFHGCNIILIESSSIGILGAGEGTTPSTVKALAGLGIKLEDYIQNTSTTIKNGIKFVNFGDKSFHYTFNTIKKEFTNQIDEYSKTDHLNSIINQIKHDHLPIYNLMGYANSLAGDDFDLYEIASEENLVPFIHNTGEKDSSGSYTNDDFAIHFDGNAFAPYLSSIGVSRGIKKIDGVVDEILADENGFITKLIVNKQEVDCDFVFDCTGFRRLIIGDFYKTKWNSVKNSLPVNRAMPYFLDIDTNSIPPYTESTAMNFGWSWKIPLQHRYGCGYVYDSNFISDDDAKNEIEKFLGHEIDVPKIFKFDAGFFENVFVKNCIAVGLSGGFVEPLEATSIGHTLQSVQNAINILLKNNFQVDQVDRDTYNQIYKNLFLEIVDFIYLHYMTNKTNTKFWSDFTHNNLMPKTLSEKIEKLNNFESINLSNRMFRNYGFYRIMMGNNILNIENIKEWLIDNNLYIDQNSFKVINENLCNKKNNFINHSEFLRNLGAKNV